MKEFRFNRKIRAVALANFLKKLNKNAKAKVGLKNSAACAGPLSEVIEFLSQKKTKPLLVDYLQIKEAELKGLQICPLGAKVIFDRRRYTIRGFSLTNKQYFLDEDAGEIVPNQTSAAFNKVTFVDIETPQLIEKVKGHQNNKRKKPEKPHKPEVKFSNYGRPPQPAPIENEERFNEEQIIAIKKTLSRAALEGLEGPLKLFLSSGYVSTHERNEAQRSKNLILFKLENIGAVKLLDAKKSAFKIESLINFSDFYEEKSPAQFCDEFILKILAGADAPDATQLAEELTEFIEAKAASIASFMLRELKADLITKINNY